MTSLDGFMTGKLKLVSLVGALVLQFVFLTVAVRVRDWSPEQESFPQTFHLLSLTLVGMAPWDSLTNDPIIGGVIVVLLITLHFVIFCGLISCLSFGLSDLAVPFVNRLSKRFSTMRASLIANIAARYEGPEGDSWLKRKLPGWYYKVTLPGQTFRRKVEEAQARENALATKDLTDGSTQASGPSRLHALDSLKGVSDDFGSHVMDIHSTMRVHTASLRNRLGEIKATLDQLKTRIGHNSG